MACIVCFITGPDAKCPLQSQVLSRNSNPTAIQAEHPILLIHFIHSTLPPSPHSLLRLHGVIFMHHQDAGADECRQYTQGHCRSRRAPLLQEITIMCCSTRFHSALTRSTSLDLVLVLKRRFIASFYTIFFFFFLGYCYAVPMFALFCLCRNNVSEGKDPTCQVYGCMGHCVKP